MEQYRVRDHMVTEVLVVTSQIDIRQAVHILLKSGFSGVPVTDDSDILKGMLTERDCMEAALHAGYHDERGGAVAEYMSTDLHTVGPDANLMGIAEIFVTLAYRRFPVVEEGKLVGLITRRDVLAALDRGNWFSR
jgi:CBS domain-containing protein